MISYVAQEASVDTDLSELALRVLIFLGGENPHIGGWSYNTHQDLATRFHVSQREVKSAQHQLLSRGFLTRRVGTITHTRPKKVPIERHFFYSTDTRDQSRT